MVKFLETCIVFFLICFECSLSVSFHLGSSCPGKRARAISLLIQRKSCLLKGDIFHFSLHFLTIFFTLTCATLQGGLGNGYKKVVGSKDDTYSPDSVALFHIKGTTGENFRATQVQPVS